MSWEQRSLPQRRSSRSCLVQRGTPRAFSLISTRWRDTCIPCFTVERGNCSRSKHDEKMYRRKRIGGTLIWVIKESRMGYCREGCNRWTSAIIKKQKGPSRRREGTLQTCKYSNDSKLHHVVVSLTCAPNQSARLFVCSSDLLSGLWFSVARFFTSHCESNC